MTINSFKLKNSWFSARLEPKAVRKNDKNIDIVDPRAQKPGIRAYTNPIVRLVMKLLGKAVEMNIDAKVYYVNKGSLRDYLGRVSISGSRRIQAIWEKRSANAAVLADLFKNDLESEILLKGKNPIENFEKIASLNPTNLKLSQSILNNLELLNKLLALKSLKSIQCMDCMITQNVYKSIEDAPHLEWVHFTSCRRESNTFDSIPEDLRLSSLKQDLSLPFNFRMGKLPPKKTFNFFIS